MFTYVLKASHAEPLYIQLYSAIKQDIISGALATGAKLPSKRAAAKQLGISVITVEYAYAGLQSEGYIFSRPKCGFFVSEIPGIFTESPRQAIADSPLIEKTPDYRFDFSSNGIVSDNFPFSVWAKLMRATMNHSAQALMLPSPAGGVPELKKALCLHLKQFRNMDVAPEQIIIGAGTEYLYTLLIQLLGRDKTYAVPNPGYAKIAAIYRSNGVRCVCIDEDAQGIDIAMLLKSDADIAHISPSHHFPSGTVMSAARRHELLNLAAEKEGRYIIEDDYDSEFRLAGRPLPSLQSLDRADKVIYVNTFTKSLSPTIRISYMVLPKPLASRFYQTLGFYACTVSTFEQYTLAAFIEEGYFERHINRMRNYYKKIRDQILAQIKSSPLASISVVAEEQAGLHFLLKLKTDLPDALLKQKAQQEGVHISFLSEYYLDNKEAAPQHIIVMNYSSIRAEEIPEAIDALGRAF